MHALRVGVNDIMRAIKDENQNFPAGNVQRGNDDRVIEVTGRVVDPGDFADLIVARRGQAPVYLRQVATVVDGQQELENVATLNGERALAIDPTSPHALYGLSTACGRLGDNEAAKRYRGQFAARKAESLSRDRATAAARLDDMPSLLLALAGWYAIAGRIERAGGDSNAAERSWLRALDAAPNQRDAAAGLLDLYRRQGREDEARSLVERRSATVAIPAGGKN
jgi:tetratricopeptide (TPR) repeat protein